MASRRPSRAWFGPQSIHRPSLDRSTFLGVRAAFLTRRACRNNRAQSRRELFTALLRHAAADDGGLGAGRCRLKTSSLTRWLGTGKSSGTHARALTRACSGNYKGHIVPRAHACAPGTFYKWFRVLKKVLRDRRKRKGTDDGPTTWSTMSCQVCGWNPSETWLARMTRETGSGWLVASTDVAVERQHVLWSRQ